MESILDVIKSYQSETYPKGVGSIFRCIKSDRFESLEADIKKVILKKITLDLYPSFKDTHTLEEVTEWVKKCM